MRPAILEQLEIVEAQVPNWIAGAVGDKGIDLDGVDERAERRRRRLLRADGRGDSGDSDCDEPASHRLRIVPQRPFPSA